MNTLFSSGSSTKKKKKVLTDGVEMLTPKAIGKAVAESTVEDIDWGEWLGFGKKSERKQQGHSVDMKPGVAYSPNEAAKHEQQAERPLPMTEYGREIIHAGETGNKKEVQESAQKIQMLVMELQRLAQSVQEIQKAVILQAVDPAAGQKTGKYYESFFEWMLLVVQDARRKVEDSGAWMAMASGKKKPGIHKQMKTNMQIALSGERSTVTQTG